MDQYIAYSNDLIEKLASTHNDFFNAEFEYKRELARMVLQKVQSDKWTYTNDWIEKSCQLENLLPTSSAEVKQLASMKKFNFGSIAKLWLTTFMNAPTISKPSRVIGKDGSYLSGPYSMGLNAPGINFELFCEPLNEQDKSYHERSKKGTVCLVLGAGNQDFITLIDIFQRVFIHNECVLIKHHPIRQFLYDPYYIILQPLIERNIVHMLEDLDNEFTKEIIKHNLITHVHFTGSKKTYDSITKSLRSAKKNWHVTAELGCVTPWIVLPEGWSENEIKNAAKQIVTAKKTNGGCNCLSAQLVILPETWEQKSIFLDELSKQIIDQKTIPSYYPNSIVNKKDFMHIYGNDGINTKSKVQIGSCSEDDEVYIINYGLISNKKQNDYCLRNEAFGPVLVIAELENNNLDTYVEKVISTLNSDKVYGSLSCSILTPSSVSNEIIDKLILELEYGTIAINTWSVFGYTAAALGGTWGGYYKTTESGRGRIGNIYQHNHVTKTVIRNESLENLQIDLSNIPPTFLLNLLFALVVKTNNSFDVLIEFIFFMIDTLLFSIIHLFRKE